MRIVQVNVYKQSKIPPFEKEYLTSYPVEYTDQDSLNKEIDKKIKELNFIGTKEFNIIHSCDLTIFAPKHY